MPLKNGMPFLKETLDSIKNQTFSNWELLIIDANSIDGSLELIKSYNERRFKVITKDLGPGLARNYGISVAKGEYIAFVDADDVWDQEKLDIQLAAMINNNFLHVYELLLIDNTANFIGKNKYFIFKMNFHKFFSKRIIVMSSGW